MATKQTKIHTTSTGARAAGVPENTFRDWGRRNLIDSQRAENGQMLFTDKSVAQATELKKARENRQAAGR